MSGRIVVAEQDVIDRVWGLRCCRARFVQLARPRFSVAPSQGNPASYIPVLRHNDSNAMELTVMQWPLLPYWSKEPRVKCNSANAGIETLLSAASYRVPLRRRRCIIPVRGWYEWQSVLGAAKQPWYWHAADGGQLGFAGVWDRWEDADSVIESCSIVVSTADNAEGRIHDRSPLILPRCQHDAWCNRRLTAPGQIMAMLQRSPRDTLRAHRVSPRINSTRYNDECLIEPLACELA